MLRLGHGSRNSVCKMATTVTFQIGIDNTSWDKQMFSSGMDVNILIYFLLP